MVLHAENSTIQTRRIVRAAAGEGGSNIPVEVVPGDKSPEVCGTSYHYRTRGGRIIWHPSAYSRSGWSNMVYVHSTIRVEVGQNWLNQP